ncbi:MAG: hypothetical protein RLP44_28130 [Aggregatilineales bacterium]
MTRVMRSFQTDIIVQFRNGFYIASGFILLMFGALLTQLPHDGSVDFALLLPAFIVSNEMMTTFYFVSALVLLEKSEGTLRALTITPLRIGEYLWAKIGSLTLLASAEMLALVVLANGFHFQLVPLVVGMALLGTIYTLIGVIAVVRYDSINQYMIPSAGLVTVLILPLIDQIGVWQSAIFYLHPIYAPMLVIRSAFAAINTPELLFGLAGSAFWISVLFVLAKRAFVQHIIVKG